MRAFLRPSVQIALAASIVIGFATLLRAEEPAPSPEAQPPGRARAEPSEGVDGPLRHNPLGVALHHVVQFVGADGNPVAVPGGFYRVERGGDKELKITSTAGRRSFTLAAQTSAHDEALETPKASAFLTEEGARVIGLLFEDGSALYAVGGNYAGKVRETQLLRLPPSRPSTRPGTARTGYTPPPVQDPNTITSARFAAIAEDILQWSAVTANASLLDDRPYRFTRVKIQYPYQTAYDSGVVSTPYSAVILQSGEQQLTRFDSIYITAQRWRVVGSEVRSLYRPPPGSLWGGITEDQTVGAVKAYVDRGRFHIELLFDHVGGTAPNFQSIRVKGLKDQDISIGDYVGPCRIAVQLTPDVDEYGRIVYSYVSISFDCETWKPNGGDWCPNHYVVQHYVDLYVSRLQRHLGDMIKAAFEHRSTKEIFTHVIHDHMKPYIDPYGSKLEAVDAAKSQGSRIVFTVQK